MNAPDKIYIQIFCKENIWTDHKVVDEENLEYILKDNILKMIDSRVTNAHEMPNDNPLKQYYEGYDAALQSIYEAIEQTKYKKLNP